MCLKRAIFAWLKDEPIQQQGLKAIFCAIPDRDYI
jgi:hypothetical protein